MRFSSVPSGRPSTPDTACSSISMKPYAITHNGSRIRFTTEDINTFCQLPLQRLQSHVFHVIKGVEGI
jgi:hypothetical protein